MEYRFVRNAVKFLESRGAYVVNTWGTSLTGSGVPDLIVCYKGFFIAFEAKDEQNVPLRPELTTVNDDHADKPQQLHLKKIRKAKGEAYVVSTMMQVEYLVGIIDSRWKSLHS